MPKFVSDLMKYVSFIRKFQATNSCRIEPQLKIHYLIAACKGEAAEIIEHDVSLEPLEKLFGNPRVITSISIIRLTKEPSIQFLDSKDC